MKRRTLLRCTLLTSFSAITSCKSESSLPVLSQVPSFAFTDQTGQALATKNLSGKPWVAAFMFTRCPTICHKITREMRKLQVRAQSEGLSVHWISFSVDPDNDTPPVLAAYAKKYEADTSNWSFLTGDFRVMQKTAEEGFKIGVSGTANGSEPHYGISHGSHLVLVDTQGMIRGYYRTTDTQAQQQLLKDLARL